MSQAQPACHSPFPVGTSGKLLLRHMLDHPSTTMPKQLAHELSLLVTEDNPMQAWCQQAIQELPEEATVVKAGNPKVLNKIVGKVMKISRGTADAQAVRATLEGMLRA